MKVFDENVVFGPAAGITIVYVPSSIGQSSLDQKMLRVTVCHCDTYMIKNAMTKTRLNKFIEPHVQDKDNEDTTQITPNNWSDGQPSAVDSMSAREVTSYRRG